MSVLLITSLGDIVIDLYTKDCPKACINFIKLCKIKYYNNCLFHNIQKDYIAQCGDKNVGCTLFTPNTQETTSIFGVLYGDNNKYFNDEIHPKYRHNKIGVVATANTAMNHNTSSFYIQLTNKHLTSLDNKHTIFGSVEEGFDVLSKINNAYCDDNGRPYQNIRIRHTVILDDPFDDIEGMIIPSKSPEPIYDNSDCTRLEDDFDINEFYKDKQTEDELKQKLREQDAKNKAIILELLEDIPDSEIKPPENVLFVCKLNPITQDDDLENIFSMYGNIKSCQIIRDRKTGESLKYAFIEYEKVEDCEKAYLKMNGVLIDDRRIKVDFSQSVAKYWYNYNNNNNSKGGDSKGNNNSNSNGNSNNNNQGDNENALNLVNENVKLEIKQTKNFNPVKDDKYKFVFSHNSNSGDTYKGYNNYNKHKYHHHQQGYYKSNYNHNHYYNNNNDYYNSNNYKHYSSHYHNTKRSRSRTDSSNRSYDSYNYSGSKYTNKYKHNNYYHNHKYKDHYYNSYHKYK